MKERKLFCEISPLFYKISVIKENALRSVRNVLSGTDFAERLCTEPLPCVVTEHSSVLIRRLHNVDLKLQENKVTNIEKACEKINGIIVNPGETFSFWKTVGKTTAKKGYKEGLVIKKGQISSGIGGGLCQMANMIHWLVLNSQMTVCELHHHTDALFPDERRRVPFGTGTSVSYKNIDYRFKNETDRPVQILVWCENGELKGELRTDEPFEFRYELIEEDHYFEKSGEDYFRNSKVYRNVYDRKTDSLVRKELILDNHSRVMYDHTLIPKEQIRR